jgi:hypothetical protein
MLSARLSSSSPKPQDVQTREVGVGGAPAGAGAAQWPQNHDHSTSWEEAVSTSLNAGRFLEMILGIPAILTADA